MHYCFADARINSYTNSSTSCKKVVKIGPAFFLPRDAMLSVVYAVVVCLSVCLSVCEIISASEVEGIVQRAVESAVKEVNEVQQLLQDRFDELQNKLMVLENRVLALEEQKADARSPSKRRLTTHTLSLQQNSMLCALKLASLSCSQTTMSNIAEEIMSDYVESAVLRVRIVG